jgi:TetR/AcrR family transcriptional regulator, cholesterol catabolism regulator
MASSIPPTRNAGGRRREREIYQAAIAIFYRRGYADTTIEEIAEAVGILKGSLYHYIDTKEDLLFGILRDVHVEVDKLLSGAREREDLSPVERLLEYVRRQATYNAKNIEKITVYYHDLNQLSPDRAEEIATLRRAHERYVIDMIGDAQRDGEIDPAFDPALVAAQVFASVGWLYTWYRPGRSVAAGKLAEFIVEFLRRGLAAPRG